MIDRHDRRLNYLRISVTDRCNLRCTYCVPRDRIPRLSHAEILRYEEILRIVRIGVGLGVTKVRVTGGEPLVRKGVIGFLESLAGISGISELTLTTNGVFLEDHAERIRAASEADATVNSLIFLDTFATSAEMDVEDCLAELEPLFATYLD